MACCGFTLVLLTQSRLTNIEQAALLWILLTLDHDFTFGIDSKANLNLNCYLFWET